MICTACHLDHEWAPDWTSAACPERAKERLSPQERARLIVEALKLTRSQEQFEQLLVAHFKAAAGASP